MSTDIARENLMALKFHLDMLEFQGKFAERQETITIGGLTLNDVGIKRQDQHWLRGGLPLSFLVKDETDSMAWRKSFIQTFLERDVPQFGIAVPDAIHARSYERSWFA